MKIVALRRRCVTVVGLCVLCAAAAMADARWVEVRSPHFSVVTDAGDKRGREVALRFEQMRAVFGALLVRAKVTQPVPLQIIAFRSTQELRQFAPLWKGKPTEVSGLYESSTDRDYIMVGLSVEDPWEVVFHEYGHQLLNTNTAANSPLWFDEGFAGYFSTIQIAGKKAYVGMPPKEARILTSGGLMKTRDLFRVGHGSRVYNESGDHRSVFYMQSWLVVHWMMHTRQLTKMPDYVAALEEGVTIETAVQRAFGMDLAQFDREIRQYWMNSRLQYHTIATTEGIESTGYAVTPLTDLDAKAILADVHLHSADYREQALREAQEVLATDANNEVALRAVGYYYLLQQDYEKAGEYFRRAARENSRDSRTHYLAAMLLNREAGGGSMDPVKVREMKDHLERAIALDPEYADAYHLLAFARISTEDRKGAVEAARRAVELNPRNPDYRMNLAQMYALSQQWEGALAVLRTLARSDNPEVVERAEDFKTRVESMREYAQRGTREGGFSEKTQAGAAPPVGLPPAEAPPVPPLPNSKEVRFTRGRLVSVDCSVKPAAVLTVATALRTWKLKVPDTEQMVLIGANRLVCDWTNKEVAVNFRETVADEGTVVSLEVQE